MKTPILSPWQSGNLFAPAWQGVTPLLKGWCDVDFDFTPIQVAVAPGSFALKNQLPVDTDADYLSREIFVAPIAGTTGDPITGIVNPSDLKIRITDGDGNAITSDWITANDLNGPVGPVPLPLRKGSIPLIDFWNQGTGTLIVQCGVKGFKRFKCSNEQGVIPPFYPASLRYCKPWRACDSRITNIRLLSPTARVLFTLRGLRTCSRLRRIRSFKSSLCRSITMLIFFGAGSPA